MLLSLLGAKNINSQTYNKKQNNYFVLVRNIGQLNAIISSAKDQAEADGKKYGEFHVVICGKSVQELTNLEKMSAIIKKANEQNVKLFACGFSLNKFEVDSTKMPKEIGVVENGISYGFKLQKDGFYSITL